MRLGLLGSALGPEAAPCSLFTHPVPFLHPVLVSHVPRKSPLEAAPASAAEMTFPPALGVLVTLDMALMTPLGIRVSHSQSFLSYAVSGAHAQAQSFIYKALLLSFLPLTHWLLRPRRHQAHKTCNSPTWFLRMAEPLISLHAKEAQLYSTIFLENSIKSHSSGRP